MGDDEQYTVLCELLLVFAYPQAVGAEALEDGTVRFAPVSTFPSKWRELAEAGAFRVQTSGNNYLDLYRPKGFLYRWVTQTLTRKVHFH